MPTQPKSALTPAEYLEIERKAEHKSEYCDGVMVPREGATAAHALVNAHLIGELREQLRGGPYQVYDSDLRVHVPATGLYAYPDASVVCGPPELLDGDTLLNPTLLAEVMSPSTEAYDRGWKAAQYRQIPSLIAYLVITRDRAHAELFTRQPDGRWNLTEQSELDTVLEVKVLGCRLALADLYEDLDFPPLDVWHRPG